MPDNPDVAAFWASFEAQIGEPILCKTMGQHYELPRSQGEWGLLVLTSSSLRFRPTPGENWFNSLFRMATPKVPESSLEDIVIPFSEVIEFTPPRKRFFDFLFSPPFSVFSIRYRRGGEERTVILAADPTSELYQSLRKRYPSRNAS